MIIALIKITNRKEGKTHDNSKKKYCNFLHETETKPYNLLFTLKKQIYLYL